MKLYIFTVLVCLEKSITWSNIGYTVYRSGKYRLSWTEYCFSFACHLTRSKVIKIWLPLNSIKIPLQLQWVKVSSPWYISVCLITWSKGHLQHMNLNVFLTGMISVSLTLLSNSWVLFCWLSFWLSVVSY